MKRSYILIYAIMIILMLYSMTGSYSAEDNVINVVETIKDSDGDKVYFFENGTMYKGPIDQRLRKDGSGEFIKEDRVLIGTFSKDVIKSGIIVYNNKDVYEGDILKDQAHGKGTMKYANGDKYMGEFLFDKPHGKGFMIYANKDTYNGEFAYGVFHGKGKFTSNDILTQGEFKYGSYVKYLPAKDFD